MLFVELGGNIEDNIFIGSEMGRQRPNDSKRLLDEITGPRATLKIGMSAGDVASLYLEAAVQPAPANIDCNRHQYDNGHNIQQRRTWKFRSNKCY